MKNRKLLLIVSLVLAMTMSLGGTLAYLTDTDADINVMTVGRVSITQNEQERNSEGKLVEFTQDKPAIPAVYEGSSIPWDVEENWPGEGGQAWKTVKDIPNVIDKFVTVTNTGNTDAYVRTIFAWEVGTEGKNANYMHFVGNANNVTDKTTWSQNWLVDDDDELIIVPIEGTTYAFMECVYQGKLAGGETTIPSLKQIYLDKTATNEVVADYGETFEVIALSQAVQASGFEGTETMSAAEVALNEAFPYVTTGENAKTIEETLTEWFTKANLDIGTPGEDWPNNNPPEDGWTIVSTADELKAALTNGAKVLMKNDITIEATKGGYNKAGIILNGATLDGNGKTLTVTNANETWSCAIYHNGGTVQNLTVSGAMRGIFTAGTSSDIIIDNVIFDDVIYTFNSDDGNKEHSVYISDSALYGWTSFSAVHNEIVFTNCTFGEGSGYAYCRPYQNVTFVGCDFEEGYELDLDDGSVNSKGIKATLENCTYNGEKLTESNVVNMLTDGEAEIPNLIIR